MSEDEFWSSAPELATIRDYALARFASPWAVLGVVLARVAYTIPPGVKLPPTIGTPASLNYFVALVGPSGSGKGVAAGVAAEVLPLAEDVETETPGSGEGLPACYVHREDGEVKQWRTAVVFDMPEVDTLTALGSRSGATLDGVLRSMWVGERLGFAYRDPSKRLPVQAHTYRASLVLGVQPDRAGPLFDAAGGGTPQRFVWLPTTDSRIGEQMPPEPDPVRLVAQDWPDELVLTIPDEAASTIRAAFVARQRGDADPLDGHALLARLKVAQLLTVLCGRRRMALEDWHRAGHVMAVSDRVRESAREALRVQAERSQESRGRMDAIRSGAADELTTERAVRRVAQVIRRHATGDLSRSQLRKKLPARDRGYFDAALERLTSTGDVEVIDTEHGERVRGGWAA